MVEANGMLGKLGWELKATYSGKNMLSTDEDRTFNYYIVHRLLMDDSVSSPSVLNPIAFAENCSKDDHKNMKWHIDDLAVLKRDRSFKIKTRGTYEPDDLNKISKTFYNLFMGEIPAEESLYIKELTCLVWLNNMHYNPIFSMIVRGNESSLKKYITIMSSLRKDYQQMEDFAKTAVDVYLLPEEYVNALI